MYTAAQAFSGTYTVTVNPVLGTGDRRTGAIGNRATLKVVSTRGPTGRRSRSTAST